MATPDRSTAAARLHRAGVAGRHLGPWFVALVLWAGVIIPYGRVAAHRLATEGVNDFTILRIAADRAAGSRPLYAPLSSIEVQRWPYESLANLNLPHTHILLRPLAALPYRSAAAAWAAASLLALFGSLLAIAWELRLPLTLQSLFVGCGVLLGSAPFVSTAVAGEVSFLLMAPFTAGWIAGRRGHWATAGAVVGLCAALKPFLGLYLCWFLLARRLRAVVAFAGTVAVAVALGVLAYGVGSYVQWFDAVARVDWWWPPENASLRGLTDRLFVPGHGMAPVMDAPRLASWAARLAAAAIVALTGWCTWRSSDDTTPPDRAAGAWFCASLLASPLGWVYYVPMLSGPILAAAMQTPRASAGRWWTLAGAALLFVPLAATERGQPSPLATVVLANVYTWGLLALWVGFLSCRGTRNDG